MNEMTYLTVSDVDTLILSYVDPPTALTLTEVNKHYFTQLNEKRLMINEVKFNAEKVYEAGSVWIYQWLLTCGKITIQPDAELLSICSFGQTELFKYVHNLHKTNNVNSISPIPADIINTACQYGHLDIVKYIHCFVEYKHYTFAFTEACIYGQLDTAKWLILVCNTIDIHAWDEYAFINVCKNGHLDVAKYLVELGQIGHGLIQIHIMDERPFRDACSAGHIHILEWLIELGETTDHGRINLHAQGTEILQSACLKRREHIAHRLIELGQQSYGAYDLSRMAPEFLKMVDISV